MDELISQYFEYKHKYDYLAKKMDKIKQNIKANLKKDGKNKFQNNIANISISDGTRSSITKKDVPSEIWEKYSKKSSYEILNIRKKIKD